MRRAEPLHEWRGVVTEHKRGAVDAANRGAGQHHLGDLVGGANLGAHFLPFRLHRSEIRASGGGSCGRLGGRRSRLDSGFRLGLVVGFRR